MNQQSTAATAATTPITVTSITVADSYIDFNNIYADVNDESVANMIVSYWGVDINNTTYEFQQ